MPFRDDDLTHFALDGTPPLPPATGEGHVIHEGARIWHASYGEGPPVILLHGGLGHSGNWAYQLPALLEKGYRVILIDSRGHGRSTRDDRPFRYELMADDVAAVMDALDLESAPIVGWSDGACIALILAMRAPARVQGVLFFGCNMDPSGTREFMATPVIERCFSRHSKDYALLSPTPDGFASLVDAVSLMMKTEPNYSAAQLAAVQTPVTVVHSEHDEFIRPEHAEYLARTIPGAELIRSMGVSHFAPLQRPDYFNSLVLGFLGKLA